MPGKILVINGHGAKIPGKTVQIDPQHKIVTPGPASDSYTISFDNMERHLEEQTSKGKIWPITTAANQEVTWQSYQEGELSDVSISPLKSDFKFAKFAEDILNKKTGWEKLTEREHDPLTQGALAIMINNNIVILEGEIKIRDYLANYSKQTDSRPLFYCDKVLGKIKPLGNTTLAEIYQGVQLIEEFKASGTSIVLATCSPDQAITRAKSIIVKTAQSPIEFSELATTQLAPEIKTQVEAQPDKAAEFDIEKVTATLPHGPRQKTPATRDLETICKAFLSGRQDIKCQFNVLGEMKIELGEEKYNLSQILENNGDFEQLDEITDAEVDAYGKMLEKGKLKLNPLIDMDGFDEFPTRDIYKMLDPDDHHKHLQYAEKLAITLYSGEHYSSINYFLRNDAMFDHRGIVGSELTGLVKELLLVSAIATRGLNKAESAMLPDESAKFDDKTHHGTVYRTETASAFGKKRIEDYKAGRITQQKGFTSASERADIEEAMNADKTKALVRLVLRVPRRPGRNLLCVKELCKYSDECEEMHPPGGEYKYYHHQSEPNLDTLYGMPVRTIESETRYNYGTQNLRVLRHELLNYIESYCYNKNVSFVRMSELNRAELTENFLACVKALNLTEGEVGFFDYIFGLINRPPAPQKKLWDALQEASPLVTQEKLIHDAVSADCPEILKRLLGDKPNVDLLYEDLPLLHLASKHDSLDVLKWLLAHGANPNTQIIAEGELKGCTPLHVAMHLNMETVRILVERGADISIAAKNTPEPISTALTSMRRGDRKLFDAMLCERTFPQFIERILSKETLQKENLLSSAMENPTFIHLMFDPQNFSKLGVEARCNLFVQAQKGKVITKPEDIYRDPVSDEDMIELVKRYVPMFNTGTPVDTLANFIAKRVLKPGVTIPGGLIDGYFKTIIESEWFARQISEFKCEFFILAVNNVRTRLNIDELYSKMKPSKEDVIYFIKNFDTLVKTVKSDLYQTQITKCLYNDCKSRPEGMEQVLAQENKNIQLDFFMFAFTDNDFELANKLWLPQFANDEYIREFLLMSLYEAIKTENAAKIQFLDSIGINIKSKFKKDGANLLHRAVQEEDVEMIERLLSLNPGIDVNEPDSYERTPLFHAIQAAKKSLNLDPLRALLQSEQVDLTLAQKGKSCLALAGWSTYDEKEIFQMLCKCGADINSYSDRGMTLLHDAAASRRGREEDVEFLLKHGADAMLKTKKNGNTALVLALINQNLAIAELLLRHVKIDTPEQFNEILDALLSSMDDELGYINIYCVSLLKIFREKFTQEDFINKIANYLASHQQNDKDYLLYVMTRSNDQVLVNLAIKNGANPDLVLETRLTRILGDNDLETNMHSLILLLMHAKSPITLSDDDIREINQGHIKNLEASLMEVLKGLPKDDERLKFYLDQLKNPASPITGLLNTLNRMYHKPTLFGQTPGTGVEHLLAKLKDQGIGVTVTPKADVSEADVSKKEVPK